MHIKAEPDGSFTSATDSPDQGIYGIKADRTIINNDTLFFEINNLKASFTGKLENDSTLFGTLKQEMEFPLTLRKKDLTEMPEKTGKRKFQTPIPPFPYNADSVEYDNADKSVHYGATLTYPLTNRIFPAVILITGSGSQDRDEAIGLHKPFAVLADYLTRNGFAVLRIDDRSKGKTTGDFMNATSVDFAKDIEVAISYLQTRKEIDLKKIGLIGHSEGGMIAPMVASQRKDIAFVILLAGPGVKIIELMTEQNAAILEKSGITEFAINAYKPLYKKIILMIAESPDSITAGKSGRVILDEWIGKTDMSIADELGFKTSKNIDDYISALVQQIYIPWFRYFVKYDPQPSLKKLRCPVLALNGDKDIQVISKQNLTGIEAALKKSRMKNYEIKELPGLNHLFQTCKKCTIQEYLELEETISPYALQIIGDWLKKNVW